MNFLKSIIVLYALGLQAFAQVRSPMPPSIEQLGRDQQIKLEKQAQDFFSAARPAVVQASQSTVVISALGQRLSFGTAITMPRTNQLGILTKWSEIARMRHQLLVTAPDGRHFPTRVMGVYPDHDLALLGIDPRAKASLRPLDLTNASSPEAGSLIAMALPNGDVGALGVVSVTERSLRRQDRAYLGVMIDFRSISQKGVTLKKVMPGSAAAIAGLRGGDTLISINHSPVTGALEMRNLLQKQAPYSEVTLGYLRKGEKFSTTATLGSLNEVQGAHRIPPQRLANMQRMGTIPNRIHDNFPSVIQSDMSIQVDYTPRDPRDNFTNDCGAPVVDLNGHAVGILIARGSRIKTYIIPAATVQKLLRETSHSTSASLLGDYVN